MRNNQIYFGNLGRIRKNQKESKRVRKNHTDLGRFKMNFESYDTAQYDMNSIQTKNHSEQFVTMIPPVSSILYR